MGRKGRNMTEKEHKYDALRLAIDLEINSLNRRIKENNKQIKGTLSGNPIAVFNKGQNTIMEEFIEKLRRWKN